jgi:hypothetical protein
MTTFLEDIFGPEQPTSPPVQDTPVVSTDTTDSPGLTAVVNAKDLPDGWRDNPSFVYVGRANPRKRLAGSPYANPFKIGEDGDRAEAIAKYRQWLQSQPELIARVRRELAGKTLVCWCAPLPCHADVLREIADNPEDEGEAATVDDADDCDWWSLLTPEQYAELTTPPQRPERCAWCKGIYRHHPDCDELHRLWQLKLTFGKHKGKRLGEVPTDYLEWAVLYADGDLRRDIARELEGRK